MRKRTAFDPTVIAGLLIAIVCILGGLILEKGDVRDVSQVTAALIVCGGTIGAVVVSTPRATLVSAVRRVPSVLRGIPDAGEIIETLVSFSLMARRGGAKTLEPAMDDIDDRFFKKAIRLLVDGFTAEEIRMMLETDMDLSERAAESDAKVFEAAGGYAPTIGIIGAVLGLIQVMKHLDQMEQVGRGIAVAFVATVYGVAVANIVFLPIGAKIRNQARSLSKTREMIVDAVLAIQEGRNPRVLRELIEPYAFDSRRGQQTQRETGPTVSFADNRKAS